MVDALKAGSAELIGPTLGDGAIVFDPIESIDDLPQGWGDEQAPGKYRLRRRSDDRYFGFQTGPNSIRTQLQPATEQLYKATRRADGKVGFSAIRSAPAAGAVGRARRGRTVLGLRACDVAAMNIQDRVFTGAAYSDPRYGKRRDRTFVVGVQCQEAGALCFCDSMGTGPRIGEGADLVLTELDECFILDARTDRARKLVEGLETEAATQADLDAVEAGLARAVDEMGRALDTDGLPERLLRNLDHPRWKEIADRCLACGNCTSVCPTCFCTTDTESSNLDGSHTERTRIWDSCFSEKHGTLHGTTVRPDIESRYRQWLTHKLGTWTSQFDSSGCTGCGRCIAWCPPGIDMPAEAAAIAGGGVSRDVNRDVANDALIALGAAPERSALLPPYREPTETITETLVPTTGTVAWKVQETNDVWTLGIEYPGMSRFDHGQFNMLSLPGIGECAISISGFSGRIVEHTIRAVGATTAALTHLKPGQQLGLRGPYGQGWPLNLGEGRSVVVIAGGIGVAPLRSAIRSMLDRSNDFASVSLLYGTRSPNDITFASELLGWAVHDRISVEVTVDHAKPTWRGHVGVVTRLLRHDPLPNNALYLLCGPEVMMRFSIQELHAQGVDDSDIYLSMERHMKCATGTCGRCQYGPWFICKDGPVFRFDQVKGYFGRHGF